MRDLSENSNKYKKYAFRKIGKFFGSCVIATMISLGVAVTLPSNNAYATVNGSDGEPEKLQIYLLQVKGMKFEYLKVKNM